MKHARNRIRIIFVMGASIMVTFTGCQVVKPYQRAYLNDHEMQPGPRASQKSDVNAMTYREGSSGGGTGKVSGGCGCN